MIRKELKYTIPIIKEDNSNFWLRYSIIHFPSSLYGVAVELYKYSDNFSEFVSDSTPPLTYSYDEILRICEFISINTVTPITLCTIIDSMDIDLGESKKSTIMSV